MSRCRTSWIRSDSPSTQSSSSGTASATSLTNQGAFLGFRPVVDYTMGNVDVGAYAELVYTTNTSTAYSAGQIGYAFGPFVKVTVAKNVYMRLQPEYGGGNVTSPTSGAPLVNYPGNLSSPAYQAANGLGRALLPSPTRTGRYSSTSSSASNQVLNTSIVEGHPSGMAFASYGLLWGPSERERSRL